MATATREQVPSPAVGPVLAAAVLGFLVGVALASIVHVVGHGSACDCPKPIAADHRGTTIQ
jgi:hypothetical protein